MRAYIAHLMPAILDGTANPGRIFDRSVNLDAVPVAKRDRSNREALTIMIAL
ncbi:hypothetical protein [Cryobacterium sp. TMT1-19]|uniref:hypothetical protein n=1 Tax=Cryobacterium sp. TMT1-19 TaxID=1259231 RepID=UPI00158229C5|nr:hypothetical protein [Cryobacterium sp. TMT1-19]